MAVKQISKQEVEGLKSIAFCTCEGVKTHTRGRSGAPVMGKTLLVQPAEVVSTNPGNTH